MATSPADALQDAAEFRDGREVEIACDACGECWFIHLADGEDITYEQTVCPCADCPGEGEEL